MLVLVMLALGACGSSDSDDEASVATTVASSTSSSTGGATPTTVTGGTAPTTTVASSPPVTRGTKAFTFGPITFHIPEEWIGFEDGGPNPPVAYVGENAGKAGNTNLRVNLNYTGTVDALQPPTCLGGGTGVGKPPTEIVLLESGFAAVGPATAEYRHWRFTCPDSEITVEGHRVWLLPVTHLSIVEQRSSPIVLDVVTTADLA